ncbi:MAG: ribosomal protein L7/L12 [Bacteroidota bacterium]|nr:ribosomal protein L7/L12 [Bacteroidota bacterium]
METEKIEIPSNAIAALEMGNKIEAIKIVRAAKGLDLKDSKDMVEAYLRGNPGLEQRFKDKQSQNNHSGKLLFILIVIGLIAYVIFSRRLY